MKNKILLYFLGLTAFALYSYPKRADSNTFTILRDAGTIIRGTLGNARIDSSSVTKRGQLTDYTQSLQLSSLTVRGTITSTSGFVGIIAVGTQTAAGEGFTLFRTTGEQEIRSWDLFQSTGEQEIRSWDLFQSTGEQEIRSWDLFQSTGEQEIRSWDLSQSTIESRLDGLRTSTNAIFAGDATTYINVDGSTQTKIGGLIISGSFTASSGTFLSGLASRGSGSQSTILGDGASGASAQATSVGFNTSVSATGATAVGFSADAQQNSVAIGASASSDNTSVAVGQLADAANTATVAIGKSARASQTKAIAVGQGSAANGQGAIAIGDSASASPTGTIGTVAIGEGSLASGENATAIGKNAISRGVESTVVGYGVIVSSHRSVALGFGLDNKISTSIMMGFSQTEFRFMVTSSAVMIGDTTNQALRDGLNVSSINRVSILRFADGSLQTGVEGIGFSAFRTTGEARIQQWILFQSTGEQEIRSWDLFQSTGESRLEGLQTFRSTGEVRLDGLQTFRSTAEARLDGIRIATTNPIAIFDEGTFQGNISSFNFTGAGVAASVAGGTVTVDIPTPAGDGVGILRATSPFIIVIGTLTAVGVDIASNTVDGLKDALSRFGYSGLTDSTTPGFRTIIYKDGNYDYRGASVPAGIEALAGGTSVNFNLVVNAAEYQMFKIWGTFEGFNVDAGNNRFDNFLVQVCSGAIVRNNNFVNINAQRNSGGFNLVDSAKVFIATGFASNFLIEGNKFIGIKGIDGLIFAGDLPAWKISNSSGGIIRGNLFRAGDQNLAGNYFGIESSTNIIIEDNTFEGGGRLINFTRGNRNIFFERNKVVITFPLEENTDKGIINIGRETAAHITTGVFSVSYNTFITSVSVPVAQRLIDIKNTGNSAMLIDGNKFIAPAGWTFVEIRGTNVKGAVLKNNDTRGIERFILDSGDATAFTGNDNFRERTEQ